MSTTFGAGWRRTLWNTPIMEVEVSEKAFLIERVRDWLGASQDPDCGPSAAAALIRHAHELLSEVQAVPGMVEVGLAATRRPTTPQPPEPGVSMKDARIVLDLLDSCVTNMARGCDVPAHNSVSQARSILGAAISHGAAQEVPDGRTPDFPPGEPYSPDSGS